MQFDASAEKSCNSGKNSEKSVNLNFCDSKYNQFFIEIEPVSDEYFEVYFILGSTCALINVSALLVGGFVITKQLKHNGQLTELGQHKLTTKMGCLFKISKILAPLIIQVIDSVLDAFYFMQLKRQRRFIHVPSWVHISQGVLLLLGKLKTSQLAPKLF